MTDEELQNLIGARLRKSWLIYEDSKKAFAPFVSNPNIRDAMVRLNKLFDRATAAFGNNQLDNCDTIAQMIDGGMIALRGAAREAGVMPMYCNHMLEDRHDRRS